MYLAVSKAKYSLYKIIDKLILLLTQIAWSDIGDYGGDLLNEIVCWYIIYYLFKFLCKLLVLE